MTTPAAVLEVIAWRKHTSTVYENLTDADLARELIEARKEIERLGNMWQDEHTEHVRLETILKSKDQTIDGLNNEIDELYEKLDQVDP
jgi:septal ring factor EnvC (AmiA/AmiB activator)